MQATFAAGLLWAWGLFAGLAATALARDFEVRLLSGKPESGVWGTAEFQVTVDAAGCVRHVSVRGQEFMSQAAVLYTSPVPPGGTAGVRTVQGEGYGDRGLSLGPPTMTTRDRNGTREFEFEHVVASRKVLDGAPLCRVRQSVAISPLGEDAVVYECEWLRTLRWDGFSLLLLFREETCRDREFVVYSETQPATGRLEKGPATERQLRNRAFTQLTVRPEVGPLHLVWATASECSFHWGDSLQLHIGPKAVPYRGTTYAGQKDRIAYRLLLPVPLQ